jgi:domain.
VLLFTTSQEQPIILIKRKRLTEGFQTLSFFTTFQAKEYHMEQKKVFITQEGLTKLKSELEYLLSVRRQEVAGKIKRAREMGGTRTMPSMKMPRMTRLSSRAEFLCWKISPGMPRL